MQSFFSGRKTFVRFRGQTCQNGGRNMASGHTKQKITRIQSSHLINCSANFPTPGYRRHYKTPTIRTLNIRPRRRKEYFKQSHQPSINQTLKHFHINLTNCIMCSFVAVMVRRFLSSGQPFSTLWCKDSQMAELANFPHFSPFLHFGVFSVIYISCSTASVASYSP